MVTPEAFPLEAVPTDAAALPPGGGRVESLRQQRSRQYTEMLGLKHPVELTDWNSLSKQAVDDALTKLFQCPFNFCLPEDPVVAEDGI